jgi:hypothetical protein
VDYTGFEKIGFKGINDHHTFKVSPWVKDGQLHGHTLKFTQEHATGTFHNAGDSLHTFKMPSDSIVPLKFKL